MGGKYFTQWGAHRALVEKSKGNGHVGRRGHRRNDIKIDIKGIGWEGVESIHRA
jgi:hypothetical protein